MQVMALSRIAIAVAVLAGSAAWPKDPLDQVDGTEDWRGDKKRRRLDTDAEVSQDESGPARPGKRSTRSDIRESQAESEVIADRRKPAARKPTPEAGDDERAALEREARRLEERALRNLERSQGLAPQRRADPPASADTETEAPERADPPRSGGARRSADAAFEDEARGRPPERLSPREEAAFRAAEERRRVEEQRQRDTERRMEEERRREEEAQWLKDEQRRRQEEAVQAAAAAKAAERKAAEDAARKLGGKLDKDGQFVDPDLQ